MAYVVPEIVEVFKNDEIHKLLRLYQLSPQLGYCLD